MRLKPAAGLALCLMAAVSAAAGVGSESKTPLERLPRLGPIVYVTAHPDDESAAILTYLARGLHARVVLLCFTRGGGGQNIEGPELGEELARLRTRELQRAVAGYGAEVRFLGAEDFGYSKSVEETLERWNEEKVLAELVRQIRTLRPLAVISHWSGQGNGGSAHHRVAGLLTRRAFAAAGDWKAFPAQLQRGLLPWQARYLLIRTYRPAEGSFEVPVQQPSPLPGKTYEQWAWEAFQNHRSQGMHLYNLEDLSFLRRYFLRVEATLPYGPPAPVSAAELVPDLAALPDLFPSVSLLARWRERLAQAAELAERARRQQEEQPADAALALVQGASLLAALRRDFPNEEPTLEAGRAQAWVADKEQEFLRAAADLAGVHLEALTDRARVTPGETVWVGLALRADHPDVLRAAGFRFATLRLETPPGWSVEPARAETTEQERRAEFFVHLPEKLDPRTGPHRPLRAHATVTTGSLELELTAPVRGLARAESARLSLAERLDPRRLFRRPQPEDSETPAQLEPVSVAPAVTLQLEPRLRLVQSTPGETTHDWCVNLTAHRPAVGKLSAWLEVPIGWYTPLPRETELRQAGERSRLCFPLTLPARIPPGSYELQAVAGRGIRTYRLARRRHFSREVHPIEDYEPARARLQVLDIRIPAGLRIGYIGFDDDPGPMLLAQLGIGVDMLDEPTLAQARLEDYDAIVIANRAYDFRPDLADANPRLLDYVKAGGTLLVEHQGRRWDPARFAPYPAQKTPNRNPRVTDETAPVRLLKPEHPVFNFPNRIGQDDWAGWVQERGLFFWESWAEDYTPLLELADPGEDPLRGGLLVARYGQGTYIYCGLALFRQLHAGVPGGVRLYVNLLSQRRRPQALNSSSHLRKP